MIGFLGANAMQIVYISVVAVIILGLFVVSCIKSHIKWKYKKARRIRIDLEDVLLPKLARANLDNLGLTDVEVVEKLLLSKYQHKKKRLYVPKATPTVFNVSILMRNIALAALYSADDRLRKRVVWANVLNVVASITFFVTIIVGLIVGLVNSWNIGWLIIGVFLTAFAIYLATIILSLLVVNIYKKANVTAMKLVKGVGIFSPEEEAKIEELYKLETLNYVMNAVLSILYLVYGIVKFIEIVGKIAKLFKK